MGKSVVARMLGDDYQALRFWIKACEMLQPNSKIESVSYEYDEIKAFDDIVVKYKKPIIDEIGRNVYLDFYQIKFHMAFDGEIKSSSLVDPSFINAEKISLLQRLKNAVQLVESQNKKCRFYLVTPWSINQDDQLAKLVSTVGGQLNLERLKEGKTDRSYMGKVRKLWRDHLELNGDDELFTILESLRIFPIAGTIEGIIDQLNTNLISVGLLPIDKSSCSNKYIAIVQALMKRGKFTFTRKELMELCKSEGLCGNIEGKNDKVFRVEIGIRSFARWTENMENTTDKLLCLIRYFDGRYLKNSFS